MLKYLHIPRKARRTSVHILVKLFCLLRWHNALMVIVPKFMKRGRLRTTCTSIFMQITTSTKKIELGDKRIRTGLVRPISSAGPTKLRGLTDPTGLTCPSHRRASQQGQKPATAFKESLKLTFDQSPLSLFLFDLF